MHIWFEICWWVKDNTASALCSCSWLYQCLFASQCMTCFYYRLSAKHLSLPSLIISSNFFSLTSTEVPIQFSDINAKACGCDLWYRTITQFSFFCYFKAMALLYDCETECSFVYLIFEALLSAQCISSIGQIIKSVCVSVSESVSQRSLTQNELNAL